MAEDWEVLRLLFSCVGDSNKRDLQPRAVDEILDDGVHDA